MLATLVYRTPGATAAIRRLPRGASAAWARHLTSASPQSPPPTPSPRKTAGPYTQKSQEYVASGESLVKSSFLSRIITPAMAQRLAPVFGLQLKPQTHQRDTLCMYERCSAAANAHLDWLVRDVGLPDTFQTWFAITQVHVWMAMVRLRAEGPEGKEAIQGMVSHLFRDMEDRLWAMGIRKNAIVDRSLKEFLSIFYGGVMSYDEALTHSDALLASALWRNLFQADPSTLEAAATFVKVVREELHHLETSVQGEAVLKGQWAFLHEATAAEAAAKVHARDEPALTADQLKQLRQHLGGGL
ncbi:ubiquinol-cytochrome C chaperone-domain-containing protein [Blastocladiella britannica]|nr:ubiquinol-cytochrome C chaperone-domain-containing protein [Blastocladiella britannica]